MLPSVPSPYEVVHSGKTVSMHSNVLNEESNHAQTNTPERAVCTLVYNIHECQLVSVMSEEHLCLAPLLLLKGHRW